MNSIKNICCIGAGYVGGPTMAVIAQQCPEIKITVVDKNKERITQWNNDDTSQLPVFEAGLEEIIKKVRNKNLYFSNDIKYAIANSDLVFLCVNNPCKIKGFGAGQAGDCDEMSEAPNLRAEATTEAAQVGTAIYEAPRNTRSH